MLMASRTHRHACTHYARHSTRVYIPLTRKQPTTNIRCAWPHTGTNTDTRAQTDRHTKKHTLIPRYTIVFAHVCACARRHNKTHIRMELNHVRTLSHALTNARALQCYAYALMRKTGPEGRVGTGREVVERGGVGEGGERGRRERGRDMRTASGHADDGGSS